VFRDNATTERGIPLVGVGDAALPRSGLSITPGAWRAPFLVRGERSNIPSMRPTVLMVDDHDGFRTRARVLLEEHGFDVVAEAATGTKGLEMAARLRPDIALVDIQLPDVDGFAVAAGIRMAGAAGHIILISGRDQADFGDRISNSAADCFIPKSELSGATLRAALK
jgi:CheY-like chemotaxis protein